MLKRWPEYGSLRDITSSVLLLKALTLLAWVGALVVLYLALGLERRESICRTDITEKSLRVAESALLESGLSQSRFSVEMDTSGSSSSRTANPSNQAVNCLIVHRRIFDVRALMMNSPEVLEVVRFDTLAYQVRVPRGFSAVEYWLPFVVLTAMIALRLKVSTATYVFRRPSGQDRIAKFWSISISVLIGLAYSLAVVAILHPYSSSFSAQADAAVSAIHVPSLVVGMILVSPVLEEVFFRKMLFADALKRGNVLLPALLLSLLFALLHLSLGSSSLLALITFGTAFGFSLCMCAVYWKTRSLSCCIAAHSSCNAGLLIQGLFT